MKEICNCSGYLLTLSSFVCRYTALSSQPSPDRRRKHVVTLQSELQKVVQAFITLVQLSPIALIAWDILNTALSSALLLSALDKVLDADQSHALLTKLARSLPSCTGKLEGDDGEEINMAVAPFYHALDGLKHMLQT